MVGLRYQIGELDIFAGIIFLIGLMELSNNNSLGLFLLGLALLKQFSGR